MDDKQTPTYETASKAAETLDFKEQYRTLLDRLDALEQRRVSQSSIPPQTIKSRHLENSIELNDPIITGNATLDSPNISTIINTGTLTLPTTTGTIALTSNIPSYSWATYNPSWTNLTIGNGSVTAKFVQINKTVHYYIKLVFGSTTTVSGVIITSIPIAANMSIITVDPPFGTVLMRDASAATSFVGLFRVNDANSGQITCHSVSGTNISLVSSSATVPFTWTTSDVVSINGTYEAS